MVADKDLSSPAIIWCDCEMSGLDPEVDQLLEVAIVPTDWNLEILDPGIDIVIKPERLPLVGLDPIVDKMHRENGLFEMLDSGVSLSAADSRIVDYLSAFGVLPQKTILAGNTIPSDRKFINKFLPKFADLLHHRMLDVTSLKLLALAWYPQVYAELNKSSDHRALGDIRESIRELQFYRERLFS